MICFFVVLDSLYVSLQRHADRFVLCLVPPSGHHKGDTGHAVTDHRVLSPRAVFQATGLVSFRSTSMEMSH